VPRECISRLESFDKSASTFVQSAATAHSTERPVEPSIQHCGLGKRLCQNCREKTHMSANSPQLATLPSSKEAVLDAAHRLLHLHGYDGLSMRELAKQSGLAKGTIYHHFQDKREIFLSVLEREFALVQHALTDAAATPGDWQTRLRAIVSAYFTISSERGVVILTALREADEIEAEVCALVHRQRAGIQAPIQTVLAEGVACGAVRAIDLELTVMSLLGLLHSFAAQQLLFGDPQVGAKLTNQAVGEHVLDIFLNGIVHKEHRA
jgi:AcrR family transcriptional regulator